MTDISPETTAAESLCHILASSEPASRSLLKIAHEMVWDMTRLQGNLRGKFEFPCPIGSTDEPARVTAIDSTSGHERLIIVPMFWSPLDEDQPEFSLQRLPTSEGGLTLFVAPYERYDILWPELKRKAVVAGLLSAGSNDFFLPVFRMVRLGTTTRVMALTGWRFLLTTMKDACIEAGETATVAEIDHLDVFCERHGKLNYFEPIRPSFLESKIGRQVLQFEALVKDIACEAIEKGLAKPADGVQATERSYPLRIAGHNAQLCIDRRMWAEYRGTPLWLSFRGQDWQRPDCAFERTLATVASDQSMELVRDTQGDGALWIPVDLACMVERSEVIRLALEQIKPWQALLATVGIDLIQVSQHIS